jgi:UDP-glucose 4-epimerase
MTFNIIGGNGPNFIRTVLVTGSAGFIGTYVCQLLLDRGFKVRGIDNYSKYGYIKRSHDDHPHYEFIEGDCKDVDLMREVMAGVDHVIHLAALIGGLRFFNDHAYDMMAENERICASLFDAAINAHLTDNLKKVTLITSSQVYEMTEEFPTPEDSTLMDPPPRSMYGFQKLAAEYFAEGARLQHGLPYTILRPFNAIGTGEEPGTYVDKAGQEVAMNHVVPEFIMKCLKSGGTEPIEMHGSGKQVRDFTHGVDFATAVAETLDINACKNQIYNVCGGMRLSMEDLLRAIHSLVYPDLDPNSLRIRYVKSFDNDVIYRYGDSSKLYRTTGWKPTKDLYGSLQEIIDYVKTTVDKD